MQHAETGELQIATDPAEFSYSPASNVTAADLQPPLT
jgi:hypothetical protein